MAEVALGLSLIKDLGDYQDPIGSGFRELVGDGQNSSQDWPNNYIIFICYLPTLIKVHNTCAKKWKNLFLSKTTFMSTFHVQFYDQVCLCFVGCSEACKWAFGERGGRESNY